MRNNTVELPTQERLRHLAECVQNELDKWLIQDPNRRASHCRACCVCDRLPDMNDNDMIAVEILRKSGPQAGLKKKDVPDDYPQEVVDSYTTHHDGLKDLVLSPRASIVDDKITICRECKTCLTKKSPSLPPYAIAHGHLYGACPDIIANRNDVELSMISTTKVQAKIFTFFGGQQKMIKGYQTIYKQDPHHVHSSNTAMNQAAVRNQIATILIGPFTKIQKDLIKHHTVVDRRNTDKAYEWVCKNNINLQQQHSAPIQYPSPVYIETDKDLEQHSVDSNIENHMEFFVYFPDNSMPTSSNGGFDSRDDFKTATASKTFSNKNYSDWDASMFIRTGNERKPDYKGLGLIQAFLRQFPYGFSGLPDDPVVKKMTMNGSRSKNKWRKRKYCDVLRHYLRLSNPLFQEGAFQLCIYNALAKQEAFDKVVLRCRNKAGNSSHAQLYSLLTAEDIQQGINEIRQQRNRRQRQSTTTIKFLSSVEAACEALPHSNEASDKARKIYFSYLHTFGLPAIFFTITPDDEWCFEVLVFSKANWVSLTSDLPKFRFVIHSNNTTPIHSSDKMAGKPTQS